MTISLADKHPLIRPPEKPGAENNFCDALSTAAEKYGTLVHAYVLMTNHVDLLVAPEKPNAISDVVQ
ncbi:hypothetical protein DJ031_16385 [bacterium endosymbiont of Escarpia laminata]|nr:MAG: hypothetical protein DJ031_16385 [bacterium endosymbiont of Escarpia laminata]